jgi:hypothetical protein
MAAHMINNVALRTELKTSQSHKSFQNISPSRRCERRFAEARKIGVQHAHLHTTLAHTRTLTSHNDKSRDPVIEQRPTPVPPRRPRKIKK